MGIKRIILLFSVVVGIFLHDAMHGAVQLRPRERFQSAVRSIIAAGRMERLAQQARIRQEAMQQALAQQLVGIPAAATQEELFRRQQERQRELEALEAMEAAAREGQTVLERLRSRMPSRTDLERAAEVAGYGTGVVARELARRGAQGAGYAAQAARPYAEKMSEAAMGVAQRAGEAAAETAQSYLQRLRERARLAAADVLRRGEEYLRSGREYLAPTAAIQSSEQILPVSPTTEELSAREQILPPTLPSEAAMQEERKKRQEISKAENLIANLGGQAFYSGLARLQQSPLEQASKPTLSFSEEIAEREIEGSAAPRFGLRPVQGPAPVPRSPVPVEEGIPAALLAAIRARGEGGAVQGLRRAVQRPAAKPVPSAAAQALTLFQQIEFRNLNLKYGGIFIESFEREAEPNMNDLTLLRAIKEKEEQAAFEG